MRRTSFSSELQNQSLLGHVIQILDLHLGVVTKPELPNSLEERLFYDSFLHGTWEISIVYHLLLQSQLSSV